MAILELDSLCINAFWVKIPSQKQMNLSAIHLYNCMMKDSPVSNQPAQLHDEKGSISLNPRSKHPSNFSDVTFTILLLI